MATPFSPFVGRPKQFFKRRQSELPSDLIDWDAPEIPELEKQRIIYEDHIKELTEDYEIDDLMKEQVFEVAFESIKAEYQSHIEKLQNDAQSKIENLQAENQNVLKQVQDDNHNSAKQLQDELTNARSKISLLLSQMKMADEDARENNVRFDELEKEVDSLRSTISALEQENKSLLEQRIDMRSQMDQMKLAEGINKEYTDRIEELEKELENQRSIIVNLEQEKENWDEERNGYQMDIENLNFRNNETTCELNHNLEIYMQKKNEVEDYKKKLDAVKNQLTYYKKLAKNRDNNDE